MEKFKITVKCNDTELMEKISDQICDSFLRDKRNEVIHVSDHEFDEKSFVIILNAKSNFVPTISYMASDKAIGDAITVSIEGLDITINEMFSNVGLPIHYNFCGLYDYVNDSIVINTTNRVVTVAFLPESMYYPVILPIYKDISH